MRLTLILALFFVALSAVPAEAQLFRKIFGKSGGRDRNKEQSDAPVPTPLPPPVVAEPAPVTPPVPVVTDTVAPEKPLNRSPNTVSGKRETISGFRIQVYNGQSRTEALRLKQEMESSYPGMKVHLVYRQPNFRVRIGDFRSQREAEQLLPEFRSLGFKTSFVVPDEVFLE
jgi:hypothetical protein